MDKVYEVSSSKKMVKSDSKPDEAADLATGQPVMFASSSKINGETQKMITLFEGMKIANSEPLQKTDSTYGQAEAVASASKESEGKKKRRRRKVKPDQYYASPLTLDQDEKEKNTTESLLPDDKNCMEFSGIGSSDFVIPCDPPAYETVEPLSALGIELVNLERWAEENFK